MSRYVHDLKTSKSQDEVNRITSDYLSREGFKQVDYEGEMVWKKGTGLALGPQFLKIIPSEGKVHIEAWIKFAILPGVFLGEMDTEGFVGGAPKRRLKKRVMAIENSLN